ncbi:MAG: hypothetical protein AAGA18_13855 [Verrucomicrobiota bacterium]
MTKVHIDRIHIQMKGVNQEKARAAAASLKDHLVSALSQIPVDGLAKAVQVPEIHTAKLIARENDSADDLNRRMVSHITESLHREVGQGKGEKA